MPSLPEPIRQRLVAEFKIAAENVAEAEDLPGKLYYFSVFFGEVGRQLNMHWDTDLVLMHNTVQAACGTIAAMAPQLPPAVAPPYDEFLAALDAISEEFVSVFDVPEIDTLRYFRAVARVAELTYVSGGNGAYLLHKGMIKL